MVIILLFQAVLIDNDSDFCGTDAHHNERPHRI